MGAYVCDLPSSSLIVLSETETSLAFFQEQCARAVAGYNELANIRLQATDVVFEILGGRRIHFGQLRLLVGSRKCGQWARLEGEVGPSLL